MFTHVEEEAQLPRLATEAWGATGEKALAEPAMRATAAVEMTFMVIIVGD
jgi:hypothetical protein